MAVARSAVDLALKADPHYLAAHTERALLLAREARETARLGKDVVTSAALLEQEAKLAAWAPGDARVSAARCRLLEAAVVVSPEPGDAPSAATTRSRPPPPPRDRRPDGQPLRPHRPSQHPPASAAPRPVAAATADARGSR